METQTKLAFSIPQFCAAHGISRPFYYSLKQQGIAPREMRRARAC